MSEAINHIKKLASNDNIKYLTFEIHSLSSINWNPDMHCHHSFEISYVKSGKGTYFVDDRSYDVQAGDIFVFNNIEYHALQVSPIEDIEHLVVHFEPRFIWSADSNLFDADYLKIFYKRSANFQNRLDRDNPITLKIGQYLREIEKEFAEKLPEYHLVVKVNLLNILVNLIRHYDYVDDSTGNIERGKNALNTINTVVNYIDEHYAEDIHMEDLVKIAFLSPSYLSILFKKLNGISPSEYITRMRVHKAVDLLKSSDKSILEIAGLCGFNNAANFYKAFKKITGTCPSDLRLSH